MFFTLKGPSSFDPVCSTVDISFIERLLLFLMGREGEGVRVNGHTLKRASLSFLFFVPVSIGLFR